MTSVYTNLWHNEAYINRMYQCGNIIAYLTALNAHKLEHESQYRHFDNPNRDPYLGYKSILTKLSRICGYSTDKREINNK